MGLRRQLRRHRNDTRFIVGGLVLLLLIFSAAFFFLSSRELERSLITNRVLLFALWNANLLLILTILFVLLRLVFKILVERKHRILGSKFKTKLIATYIGLSLFPVLLLFFFANQLLKGSIERWFNAPLQEIVDNARDVAQTFNDRLEQDNRRVVARILGELEGMRAEDLAQTEQLTQRLRGWMEEYGVDFLAVYEGTDFLRAVLSPRSGIVELPDPGYNLLRKALDEGEATRIKPLAGGNTRLILVARSSPASSVPGPAAEDTGPPGEGAGPPGEGADLPDPPPVPQTPLIVVSGIAIDSPLAGKIQQMLEAYLAHRQAVVLETDIKRSQTLLFLMATLLILLASSWVGLYLARRVTVPIQALAEGTRRIKSGDLAHRVEVDAGDELGVLVDSFNRMTREIERSRRELLETNRRQAEERALIAAVLQNVAAGVISLDREGRIFTCNGAARAMLHLRSPLRGHTPEDLWSDPERGKLVELLSDPEHENRRLSRQVEMVLGGEWKTFEVTVTPMLDSEELSMGRVMVLEDLTELIKAQKMAAWTEAARRIAHEIKNPLTPIRLSAERLLRKHRQGDPKAVGQALEEAVEIIGREVATMQNMVDEFSRYARMPQPQPAAVDLERLVGETVYLYQDIKPGVSVRGEVAEEARTTWLDAELFKSALINLLDNAVEATDAPGEVKVSAQRDDGLVRIQVADTGRGIPPESKEKLFMPYFSTKGRGTGLGLAIVHRIVSDHHGQIHVEDNHPKGTLFTVELPVRS